MSFSGSMKLTTGLIILMMLAFVMIAAQPTEPQEHALNEFGFSKATFLEKPWTPITSIFLHADLVHLLSNILVLLFFGMAVESEMGDKKYLAIFFLAGITGAMLAGMFYPAATVSIGASGAIFGLVGAGMLVQPASMSVFPYLMPIPLAIVGLLYIMYNAMGVIQDPTGQISYIAHFGGLIIGLAFGVHARGILSSIKILILAAVGAVAVMIVYLFIMNSMAAGII